MEDKEWESKCGGSGCDGGEIPTGKGDKEPEFSGICGDDKDKEEVSEAIFETAKEDCKEGSKVSKIVVLQLLQLIQLQNSVHATLAA